MYNKRRGFFNKYTLFLLVVIFVIGYLLLRDGQETVKVGATTLMIANTKRELQQAEKDTQSLETVFKDFDNYTSFKETDYLILENSEKNKDIFMGYKIYNKDADELVFETELLRSGYSYYWYPYKDLNTGVYN